MATLPVVNAFDRRVGIISAVVAMLGLLIAILLMQYEIADPPPVDIPMKLAQPIDQTIIENVVIEMGGGGGGDQSADPKNNPNQTEAIITQADSHVEVNSGQGNVTNSNSDNPPAGNETEDHFDGGNNGGTGGGEDGHFGPGTGPGEGPGPGGPGNGSGRKEITKVTSLPNYDHVVKFRFKLTIDQKGNIINVQNIKAATTTTDQVLINKVRQAVMSQLKYSPSPGSPVVTKIYNLTLQPK